MLLGPQPFSLRLEWPQGAGFRPGGLVSVQVLERLGADRWLVSVRGRTIPVSAEVELVPGARFLARTLRVGGRIVLRVLQPAGAEAPGAGPAAPAAADRVAAAFLAAGLNPRAEAVQKVRRLLERLRLPAEDFARQAVMLLDKGVDLDSPGVAALMADLSYGRGGGRKQSRPWPSEPEELAGELNRDLGKAGEGEAGALSLFNHLQPRAEQWVVIPYSYGEISGTIRLRRMAPALQADRLVLCAGGRWSFVLDRKAAGFRLRALCAGVPALRARRGWRRLAQKLQNLGVETDDTILGDDGFDGFSLPGEAGPYQRVDTEG